MSRVARRSAKLPLWLRRLVRVREELRGVRFPESAEEGLRQAAALSVVALGMLEDAVRSARGRADAWQARQGVRRLLARMTRADERRIRSWKEERARCFGR